MSPNRVPALVAVTVMLVAVTLPASPARASAEVQMESDVVAAINAERQARGYAPLPNSGNVAYARQRAREQPARGLDGHAGFDHGSAMDGPSGAAAENLVWSDQAHGARDAVKRWMGSDPHRANILAERVDRMAVGADCRDGHWVMVVHVVWDDPGDFYADREGPVPPPEPRLADSGGATCPTVDPSPQPPQAPTATEPPVAVEGPTEVEPAPAAAPVDEAGLGRIIDRVCPGVGPDTDEELDADDALRQRAVACVMSFEVVDLVPAHEPFLQPRTPTLHELAALR